MKLFALCVMLALTASPIAMFLSAWLCFWIWFAVNFVVYKEEVHV